MKNQPSASKPLLDNAAAVMSVGTRPFAGRRITSLVAASVLLSALALAPQDAQAAGWRDAPQNKSTSAREYGRDETLRATEGRLAEVVMVRPVEVHNTNRVTLGSGVGAAAGVAAAGNVENRNVRNAARLLFGGIGAVAGQKIQRHFGGRDAVQITVMERGKDGRTKLTNVVQDQDPRIAIAPGDVVMLEGPTDRLRVVPLDPQFQARLRGETPSAAPAAEEAPLPYSTLEERRARQAQNQAPVPAQPEPAAPRRPRMGP